MIFLSKRFFGIGVVFSEGQIILAFQNFLLYNEKVYLCTLFIDDVFLFLMKGGLWQYPMLKLNRIFNKSSSDKPKAVAFVDYEHWYISLDKFYHLRPNIKAFRNELAKKYDIKDIIFFGDFSNQSLRYEIPKIREVTNFIIETQNASAHHKKDFTDFIMLDHIYQKAMTDDDTQVFIIFSGDGHFSTVASFLAHKCNKEVGVYGVKNAMSNQLRNSADWCVEVPSEEERNDGFCRLILKSLKGLKTETKGRVSRPTFKYTVEKISIGYNIDPMTVKNILQFMIDKGYLYQTSEYISNQKSIRVLNIDWAIIKMEKGWTEENL